MKNLKTLLALLFFLSFYKTGISQYKVKETSEKEVPAWISQNEAGLIVVKGLGATIDESKLNACSRASDSILKIALKSLSEDIYFKNNDYDDKVAKVNLNRSEYIKSIGPDMIQAFYWEKHYYKKSKTEQYECTVKYPVDLAIIQQLNEDYVNDYKLLDDAGALIKLSKNIDELKKVWKDLMNLNAKFPDSEVRKRECELLLKKVGEKFESVQVKEMMSIPGKLIVAQTLNDRGILSSREPIFISPCAKVLNIKNYFDEWRIDYSYDKCPTYTPTKIKVEFDNEYNKKSEEFEVDLQQVRAEIKLSETKIAISGNKSITVYISSRYRSDVILDRIVLYFNDIHFIDTKLNQELNGAGLYNIDFTLPPDFESVKIDDGIRGELYYTLKINGQKGEFRFYNHKVKRN